MALSFKYLLHLMKNIHTFPNFKEDRKKGGYRWSGPHFLFFLRYVSDLPFDCDLERFSDLLRRVEESADICRKAKTYNYQQRQSNMVKFLQVMAAFLPELGEFFAVPRPRQLSFHTTPKRNELVAAFIDFLIKAVDQFFIQKRLLRFNPTLINPLFQELNFLLFILGDTPLRFAQVEETKNILAEIESIANEAGIFVHSFLFTTDLVEDHKIEVAISDLLPKFEIMKQKIKKYWIALPNLSCVKTSNTTLASIFIVDSLLDYLNHLINNEAHLIAEVKDQITTLFEEMHLSRSFLWDIEMKPGEDSIKQTIMQLIDLAYEAEYVLTWFVSGEVPIWYIIPRISNLIQKHKLIRTAIRETELNYGINNLQVVESPQQVSSQVSNSALIDEEIIVGLNDETMRIASQLVGGPNHLQMISITGMPGLGKTTLAKKLYNHLSVVNHFDQRLWCVVSQTYQRPRLLRSILSPISKLNEDKFLEKEREDSELGEYLYKSLKGRRYLIVMDDIWDIQAWNVVKMYFPKDNTRSKILFTTRSRHLALEASADAIINELRLLSTDQCWDLLRQKVFGKSIFPPELEQIGKQIVTSCKGLPLAVAGIAAILANMEKKESAWRQVSESLTSHISKDQDILELSYKHLPIHLKPCFLYFSAFKEDKEIPVKKLLLLWISEGFIRQNKDKRSEDIAEEYLIELINRNMVQVAKRRSNKGVKACKVHDLMHDMALRIAKEEKFLNVIKEVDFGDDGHCRHNVATDDDSTLLQLSNGFSLYEQHRRLSNLSYFRDIKSRLFGLHIRSLLGTSVSSFNVSGMRLVRVLECKDGEDHEDQKHTRLVQLRYLEIPRIRFQMSTRIMNLEFLILTEQFYLNSEFSHMPKLRYLHSEMRLTFIEPEKFSKNCCLETLSGVRLESLKDEETLRCFPNLRCLKCDYGFSCNHCPDVSYLTHLESLNMKFYNPEVQITANNFPSSIKKLSLSCGSFGMMSSIGKLPNLEILELKYIKGQHWSTNDDEFQKLKCLKLRNLHLENWITSQDHFPVLERLVLQSCWCLEVIPLELGYIPTLQMIEVHYHCHASIGESALKIRKDTNKTRATHPAASSSQGNIGADFTPSSRSYKNTGYTSGIDKQCEYNHERIQAGHRNHIQNEVFVCFFTGKTIACRKHLVWVR